MHKICPFCRYLNSARAVSSSYKNRPQKALDTAIWWVEYVAKTQGGPLLRSSSANMSAFVYYCLDIYLFFIVLILSLVFLGRVLLKRFCKSSNKKMKTN